MIDQTIQGLIENLMEQSRLGKVQKPVVSVSGGFMHRMYQVTTRQGMFAVKHLNREIMKRPDAKDNYARAEKIEKIMEEHELPIVSAIEIAGEKMQKVEEDFFYIFAWEEGSITDWNHISGKQCFLAGNILGRMHAIQPQVVPHREPETCEYDWQQYIELAREAGSEIADDLVKAEQLLVHAQTEVNHARKILPDILCISDEDMDPKNIMWHEGQPKVIDLECLDYGNPVSHVLQLSLQWSGITTCDIDITKTTAFFDGYLQAYDNGFRNYSDVFGLAFTWIEWLAYNADRALGKCMDEEERRVGIEQVRQTINRIQYIKDHEDMIKDTLNSYMQKIG